MKTTRREFVRLGALGVSVSFLAPDLMIPRAIGAESHGDPILVIVQLAGGNDTVNTFIPYTDPLYRSLRPSLAIPDADILKVDGRLGFHPAMESLVPQWERGTFSFVSNVGFDSLDRSHFHCEDVWQTAMEGDLHSMHHQSGWVGRLADLYLGDESTSVTTVSIGNGIPVGMRAEEVLASAIASPDEFDVRIFSDDPEQIDLYREILRSTYEIGRDGTVETARLYGSDMFETIDLVKDLPPSSSEVEYPASQLGEGLSLAARMVAAGFGTRAIWVKTGGYDTHSEQADTHETLLRDLSDSLAAFQDDIDRRGLSDRVVVMGWSEFGRRVQENASGGTDHGSAGNVFLMGQRINGRTFYGDAPDLSRLENGDLKTEIDFRSIYWTIIEDLFGFDPEPVLMGRFDNLGFLRAAPGGRRRGVRL